MQGQGAEVEDLRTRVALVTGVGRRRGIGSAICRALADRGADVFFTYWKAYDRDAPWSTDEAEPEVLLGELRAAGVQAEELELDLSLPDSPGRLLDAVIERLGPPSILVNNAAYSTRDGFERLDARTLDAHYAVNLRAAALLSVGFARRYPGGSGGRIINLTSGQSLGPMPEELKRELAAESPMGRVGEPEDAARLVAFLAGDEARWITGQIIHSEGGFLRS